MLKVIEPGDGRNYACIEPTAGQDQLYRLDPEVIKTLFREHGALLFRGFPLDLDSLTRFSSQFCARFVRNESGRRINVSGDGTTQTVNLGQEAFPLHPELSRVPWRPDIAWFACASPPSTGGETLLCDGVPVVNNLEPATRDKLMDRSILYREETPLEAFTDWLGIPAPDETALQRLSETSAFKFEYQHGRIFRSFMRPFFHKPLFTDDLAFGNFLLFARFMLKARVFPTFEDGTIIPDEICEELRSVTDRLTTVHRWQPGDILMVDNSRVMHGRNTVHDLQERVIWTQFGYLSFLPDDCDKSEPWRMSDDARQIFFGSGARQAVLASGPRPANQG